jgi:FxsC-like protein
MGYLPNVGDLDEHLDALLGDEQADGPGVLLVDARATLQAECQDKLRRIDGLGRPWVRLVVPWNRKDPEILKAEPKLKKSLEMALKEKLAAGRVDCRIAISGVPSLEEFSMILPMVVRVAVRHYLAHAHAYPPPGPASERPRLIGPMADPSNSEHFHERNK